MEGDSEVPVLAPFLIGVVTARFAGKILRPIWKGMVKTTVVVAAEAKKAAAEMREDIQDISAEVSVERAADEATRGVRTDEATRGARAGVVTTKETKTGVVSSRGADVTR